MIQQDNQCCAASERLGSIKTGMTGKNPLIQVTSLKLFVVRCSWKKLILSWKLVCFFPAFRFPAWNAAFGGWLISESLGPPDDSNELWKGWIWVGWFQIMRREGSCLIPSHEILFQKTASLFCFVKWVHRLEWFTHNYAVSFIGSHCSKHLPRRVDSDESLSGRKNTSDFRISTPKKNRAGGSKTPKSKVSKLPKS